MHEHSENIIPAAITLAEAYKHIYEYIIQVNIMCQKLQTHNPNPDL